MKLSLNWINDYVEIPKDIDNSRLAYDLTMATVEVEGMVDLGKQFDGMVVGVVKEILPHPNADKLVICKTDIGDGEIKDIVCGGSNLTEEMKVAVAPPGTEVLWHGEGEPVKLKKAKIRGVESYGMICSSSEIGLFELFPFVDEATIIDLSDFSAVPGTPLADALGLADTILEIDNKSLTNRPDLWGHYGIAREIATLYNLSLKEIQPYDLTCSLSANEESSPNKDFEIVINDTERCLRYVGVKLEGLLAKQASFEIQSRIWRVGLRPINAIVDTTNYVMLATGQPTHAFDADVIDGNIVIRRARENEKLLMLSGKELTLTPEDLVIADEADAMALAGVMGGEKDSVHDETKSVILEIANFDALSVRRTSMRHDIRTDSATRFEKGIDPDRVDIALSVAMQVFESMFPDMTVTGYADNYPKKIERKKIDISLDLLAERLGERLPNERLEKTLSLMGFDVKFAKNDTDCMCVTAPTWRSTGDISIPADIVEEIARIYGYENFKPTPIVTTFERSINQPKIDLDRKIREYLAFRCGMNEVMTYPWVDNEYLSALYPGIMQEEMLELAAPPSPDERYLRHSLLPHLCKAAADNLRYFGEFAIFESAQVFFNKEYSKPYNPKESLPLQRKYTAGAFVGKPDELNALFRRSKGTLEELSRYIHMESLHFERLHKPVWADDTVWLNIMTKQGKIGDLALLSRKAALDCGIKNASVMLFEMDIDLLEPLASRTNTFEHISEYPTTQQDFSMLFELSTEWSEIYDTIAGKKSPDSLIQDVLFVEEYRGSQVPENKKSLTIKLVIGSNGKTLTSDEIEKCAGAVIKRLEKRLSAVLR